MTMMITPPSTLDGIKRRAKSIKSEQGFKHASALDIASREAGYQNFRHAQNSLKHNSHATPKVIGHHIDLTAIWVDIKTREGGRETLELVLQNPLSDLLGSRRKLGAFQLTDDDHLIYNHRASSQNDARELARWAFNMLLFMDATKLRPSNSSVFDTSANRSNEQLPGRDHDRVWRDPATNRYILTDEPYVRAIEKIEAERDAWAQQHKFTIIKPEWPGRHNPRPCEHTSYNGTQLYLITKEKDRDWLQSIAEKLNQSQAPISLGDWPGISRPFKLPPAPPAL